MNLVLVFILLANLEKQTIFSTRKTKRIDVYYVCLSKLLYNEFLIENSLAAGRTICLLACLHTL